MSSKMTGTPALNKSLRAQTWLDLVEERKENRMENEAVDGVSIRVMEDGPLIVTGLSELLTPKGEAFPVKTKIALCRCGASAKKPFCDGAHVGAGFSGARETDKQLDKTRAYAGEKITIQDKLVQEHLRTPRG